MEVPQPAFLIGKGAAQSRLYIASLQRIKLKQPTPGHDSAGHGYHGVFRSGADKADGAVFQCGKEPVALGLAPAVAFIQQQISRLVVQPQVLFRFVKNIPQLFYPGGYGIELYKPPAGGIGNDPGQRGLSRAGRAKEDGGLKTVGHNSPAQKPSGAYNMLLPDELIQGSGTHTIGQGGLLSAVVIK